MVKKTSRWQEKSLGEATKPKGQAATKSFLIQNELGLHARAAAQFVKVASRYKSSVKLRKDSREVNGKSIMGLLMLAASKGSRIELTVEGEDSVPALQELSGLIEGKFGEK